MASHAVLGNPRPRGQCSICRKVNLPRDLPCSLGLEADSCVIPSEICKEKIIKWLEYGDFFKSLFWVRMLRHEKIHYLCFFFFFFSMKSQVENLFRIFIAWAELIDELIHSPWEAPQGGESTREAMSCDMTVSAQEHLGASCDLWVLPVHHPLSQWGLPFYVSHGVSQPSGGQAMEWAVKGISTPRWFC